MGKLITVFWRDIPSHIIFKIGEEILKILKQIIHNPLSTMKSNYLRQCFQMIY